MYVGFKVFMSKKYFILLLFDWSEFKKIFYEITNRILSIELGIFFMVQVIILGEAAHMLSFFFVIVIRRGARSQ